MLRTLERNDIVNKKITKLWVSPWITIPSTEDHDPFDGETFYMQRAFVELETGVIFEIAGQDSYDESPIYLVEPFSTELIPAEPKFAAMCVGKIVREVLTSDNPTLVVLLSNKIVMHGMVGPPWVFTTWIYPLQDEDVGDFVTYWGLQKLCLENYVFDDVATPADS